MKVVVHTDYTPLEAFVRSIPARFEAGEGVVVYKGRNELRRFEAEGVTLVVKSFQRPHLLNRFVYKFIRGSKAARSFWYALKLERCGIGTPAPVGYLVSSGPLLVNKSYYVCLQSESPYTYRDFARQTFPNQERILRAIARTTARLHDHGMLHKDYSAGNILFKELPDGEVQVEIIDLNRMRFGRVSMEAGCKNFERLPGTDEMLRTLADEYARQRGFDPDTCFQLILEAVRMSPYSK